MTSPKRAPVPTSNRAAHPLGDPTFRAALVRALRRRLPEDDAEDIVQSAFAEVVATGKENDEPVVLKRWIAAVARNKTIDHLRKRREVLADDTADVADTRAHESDELLRWAEREMPSGEGAEETLEWMLREAEGETLESIARESHVPAARVRKRVSRLREHFRRRWVLYTAALAALGVAALLARRLPSGDPVAPIAKDVPSVALPPPSPVEVAAGLRKRAFTACGAGDARTCLDLLDEARDLDRAGDDATEVKNARRAALDILSPPLPLPEPTSSGRVIGPAPSGMRAPSPAPSSK